MPATEYASVDEYIAAQPAPARAVLERVRATIRKALPRATEGISYQIPVYKIDGRMVLYFAGFQRHYSIYPATARIVQGLGKELAGLLHSKATIRFAYTAAVPARLISRIAKLRATEVAELQNRQAKGAKRTVSKKAPSKRRTALSKTGGSRATPSKKRKASADPNKKRGSRDTRLKKRNTRTPRSKNR
jgi:uncharacterized protein YdhG (YjbR/CyaY superfamily)